MRKHPIRSGRGANGKAKLLEAPMSAAQMAKLLSEARKPIKPATIRGHIELGAPVDRRGRLRLTSYVAWLVGRLAQRRDRKD